MTRLFWCDWQQLARTAGLPSGLTNVVVCLAAGPGCTADQHALQQRFGGMRSTGPFGGRLTRQMRKLGSRLLRTLRPGADSKPSNLKAGQKSDGNPMSTQR